MLNGVTAVNSTCTNAVGIFDCPT